MSTNQCVALIEQAFEAGCPQLISTDPPPRLAALPMWHGDVKGWRRVLFRYGSIFVYGVGPSGAHGVGGDVARIPTLGLVWCRFIQAGWVDEEPAVVTLFCDPMSVAAMPWECRFSHLEAFAPHLQPQLPPRINVEGAIRITRYLAALFFGGAEGKIVELPPRDWSLVPGIARPPGEDSQ